jgi:hypothetical protein
LGVAGLALCVGGWFGRDQMLHRPPEFALPTYAAAASVFIAATVLGWVWMAYNGLIDLRQRVRQAWAQVDVQLKRRHDLIPNLIQLVTGLRDYEKSVQTEVAALRTQLNATPPGQPGPDPAAFAPVLGSVMERYPELKAQASFMNLHKAVVDSEQRIAVSRSYFNDIATFYNTRLQIVPDRFIADLGRLQPQPLMAANNFERAPVQVNLAQ